MKKRSESVFGLHFDFHASPYPGRPAVGATLKEEEIREICQLIRPDFLQIDCKGHPGWASYPTACENAMPEIIGDPLAMWRRVTREEGVALYMHYSGVIDNRYCKEHPEDAVVNADGTRSESVTRTMGGYADNLLIPQMMELAGKYGVDGIWIDGECWGTCLDYHPDTIAAFEKETGISLNGQLPVKREDPYYVEYRDFNRELFRRYVRHYTDTVHAKYPNFQIASNWAFSDHMPEEVCAGVDFLSGDFSPWNAFNIARYAGRSLAQQGRTWDLMAWNFRAMQNGKPGGLPKHPIQIMQEAATVLAVGGGFQNYITQYPDGSPRIDQIRRMKPVADYVRARQDYCVHGNPEHEAVVLLSTFDRYRESGNLFSRCGMNRAAGLTCVLCDTGHSTEIACEHTLKGHCSDYKLIAIPELFEGLEPEMIAELLDYAKNGGNLLLAGRKVCDVFAKAGVPLTLDSEKREEAWMWYTVDGEAFGMLRDAHNVTAQGEVVAKMGGAPRAANESAAVIIPFGKGTVTALAADLGGQYYDCVQCTHRDLIRTICDKLYTPATKIESALGMLEIVNLKKDGKLFIQLVNANGNHGSISTGTEDFIPPIVDIKLSIALDKAPKALILRPDNRELPFEYRDGRAYVEVGRVDLHDIIEVVE